MPEFDKIGFADLFDFNDNTNIDKGIKTIQSLNRVYTKLADTFDKNGDNARNAFDAMNKSIQALAANMERLSVASGKDTQQILKLAATISQQNEAAKKLQATEQKYVATAERLRKENEKLLEAKNKLVASQSRVKKSIDAEAGSLNDLKNKLREAEAAYRALGDNSSDIVKEDSLRRVKALSREINEQQAALKTAKRGADAAAGSYYALTQEQARLGKALRSIPGAFDEVTGAINKQNPTVARLYAQYTQAETRLKAFDSELGRFHRNVGNYTSAFDKVGGNIKGMVLGMASSLVGLAALQQGAQKVFRGNVELSDSMTDVQKTTGLTAEEVDNLNESLKTLDTRTGQLDLLNIATVGGQIGVAADEIDEFTEAIDVAAVALGDEFSGGAEQVATELGKLNNVFEEIQGATIDERLLNIADAVNELGASGAATSPFLTEVALRVGAVANTAGISLDKVLAYAATLESLGFTAEVSGTAINKLIGNLAVKREEFFAIAQLADANLTLEEFTDLINTDANAALQLFLDGLNKGGSTTTAFNDLLASLNIKGAASASVISSLAQNLDEYERYQKIANDQLREGASVADEFAVKNDNLAGSWDKLTKSIGNLFTSGSIGGFFKAAVDDVRGLIGALDGTRKAQREAYKESANAAYQAKEQADQLENLTREYEKLQRVQKPTADQQQRMSVIVAELRTNYGKSTVAIDKESGKLSINREEIEKQITARRQLAKTSVESAQKQLQATADRAAKEREESAALQKEADALKDRMLALKKEAGGQEYAGFFGGANEEATEYRKALEAYEKVQKQATEAADDYNKTLEEQKELEKIVTGVTFNIRDALGDLSGQLKDTTSDFKSFAADIGATPLPEGTTTPATPFDPEAAAKLEEERKERIRREKEAWLELRAFRLETEADTIERELETMEEGFEARNAAIKLAAHKRIQAAKLNADALLLNEELLSSERLLILEQYAAKAAELERASADALKTEEINIENENDDVLLRPLNKAVKEMPENIKKMVDLQSDRVKKTGEQYEKDRKKFEEEEKEKTRIAEEQQRKRDELINVAAQFAYQISDTISAFSAAESEREAMEIEARYERDLEAAGDNAEARIQVEENYQKEQRRLRREEAKAEKTRALFEVAINTGVAVAKAWSASPLTFGLPWSAAALVMGALQAAAIQAKPLPAYFVGTESAKPGLATVAEKGAELVYNTDGSAELITIPSLHEFKGGEKVKTAAQTKEILKSVEFNNSKHYKRVYFEDIKALHTVYNEKQAYREPMLPTEFKKEEIYKGSETVLKSVTVNARTENISNSYTAGARNIVEKDKEGAKQLHHALKSSFEGSFTNYSRKIEQALSNQSNYTLIVNRDGSVEEFKEKGNVREHFLNGKYNRRR